MSPVLDMRDEMPADPAAGMAHRIGTAGGGARLR
ncbi:hypothetical protein C7456_105191 [Fulvimonas soli]|jgi:hypothetical protein|uniref:Uncharacterized protein n=1 Tax=Fulvimonas soli TaxID=155197 RepID=A0A316I7Z5_9GAMM|nr:hypothetical protein C7456_105191 [Fulvimonas soli]